LPPSKGLPVSDAPALAIVIVSYNVRGDLDACLRSIAGRTAPHDTTIVVVDNASTDGTPDLIRASHPGVRLIEHAENVGFARANNIGIRATTSDLVLLLNPDTIVPDGAIQRLARTLARESDAACVGPRLVDAAGRAELSFGWTIGPLAELRQKAIGALYERGVGVATRWVERRTRESGEREWVSGACLLARRGDLDAVGLFDERFFMYTEDVDLCASFRARGRKVLFDASVEVQHLRGRSAAVNPRTEALRRQSHIAYYEKHHPALVPLLKFYLTLKGR
jgi:N-acetylglucosaminyl-diphospho-decaprenol L-rhamnosyltransferase